MENISFYAVDEFHNNQAKIIRAESGYINAVECFIW